MAPTTKPSAAEAVAAPATSAADDASAAKARKDARAWIDAVVAASQATLAAAEGDDPKAFWQGFAEDMVCDSVVELPLFSEAQAARLHAALMGEFAHAPEWKVPPILSSTKRIKPAERHSLGSFGRARANSVNHGLVAIAVREAYDLMIHERFLPHLVPLLAQRQKRAEWGGRVDAVRAYQLPDGVLARDAYSKVGYESGHRDAGTEDRPDAVRFGGWVALNTADGSPQQFRCATGSSLWRVTKGGFDKAAVANISKATLARMRNIAVRLGRVVFFDESIVHEVKPSPKAKKGTPKPHAPMTRVFVASELSIELRRESVKEFLRQMLQRGGDYPLKSGQKMPGYPKMYWGLQFDTLDQCAARLREICTETRTVTSRNSKHYGRVVHTPKHCQPWPSVVDLGRPSPPYSASLIRSIVDGYPVRRC